MMTVLDELRTVAFLTMGENWFCLLPIVISRSLSVSRIMQVIVDLALK
jgi:hypothetical protein